MLQKYRGKSHRLLTQLKTAIGDVAIALRRNLDEAAFDRILATLPEGAMQFWKP
jgi:uncharacterized protein (DUF2267 family)